MSASLLGTIAVRLAAKTAEFNRDIDKASGKLGSISSAAASVAKKSAIAFAGMSGAIAVLTKFASEQIQAERQLAGAFKATGQSLDMERYKAFAAGLQNITTTGADTIMGMGAMMGSFGLAQSQIEALIPGVLDLAAVTGKSADTIAMQLTRAVVEGTADLSRYGVFLSDTEKETLELGTTSERTALLVGKLAGSHGQAALAASTAAGRMEQLGNSLGDVLEETGGWIDAPLAAAFDAIRGSVDRAVAAIGGFDSTTKSTLGTIALVTTGLLGVTTAVGSILMVLPKLKAAFALGFGPVGLIVGAIALAIGAVVYALADVNAQLKPLQDARRDLYGKSASGESMGDITARVTAERDTENSGTVNLLGDFGKRVNEAAEKAKKAAADMKSAAEAAFQAMVKAGKAFDMSQWDIDDEMKKLGDKMMSDMSGLPARDLRGGSIGRGDPMVGGGATGSLREGIDNGIYDATRKTASNLGLSGKAAQHFGEAVEGGAAVAVDAIASGGEKISAVMQGATQGFASGGPWGAVAGAIVGLLSKTEFFGKLMGMVEGALGALMEMLDEVLAPIFELLKPLHELTMAFHNIGKGTSLIGPAAEVLGWILKQVGAVLSWVADGITSVYNWIVEVLADFVGWFSDDWARRIRDAKIDTSPSEPAPAPPTPAPPTPNDPLANLGNAADDTAASLRDLNEQLSNVPSGFKIDLRRYQTSQGETLDPNVGGGRGDRGQTIFNIYANDLDHAARKLEEIESFRQLTRGAKIPHRAPYSVPREGG